MKTSTEGRARHTQVAPSDDFEENENDLSSLKMITYMHPAQSGQSQVEEDVASVPASAGRVCQPMTSDNTIERTVSSGRCAEFGISKSPLTFRARSRLGSAPLLNRRCR